jgi:hypothetical protein
VKHILNIDYDQSDSKDDFLTIYKPTSSANFVPEWFRTLESDPVMKTAKSCRGVYDAMTAGYMVVWNTDVVISKDENGKMFMLRTRDGSNANFHPHPGMQLGTYPSALLSMQREGVQKIDTQYRIKTSKGTSILMQQPSYRPDLKTEVMPGIIDTDKFYSPLNVLFMIKEFNSNRSIKINAGTPLAQIIPFQRTEWNIEYNNIDRPLLETQERNIDSLDKYYQKFQWTKKIFK